jgi:hypothetical protein
MTASITRAEPRPHAESSAAAGPQPAPDRDAPGRSGRAVEVAVVVLLLLGAIAIHWGTLGHQLTERHDWRQTQTALTAVDFHEHGIDLFHPKLPVFGIRSEVPFEFPLFQAAATVPMNLGLDADTSMRVTALACFLLTAVLLYGLIRRVGGRVAALGALVAFLFSPFAVQWSHASLIEYLATAAAVGFVWAGIEWRERRRWLFLTLAIVVGAVAMSVKITTGFFWILPLVLYTGAHEVKGALPWLKERVRPGLIAAVMVPVAVGAWWNLHADAIKEAHLATRWLSRANAQAHDFGTLDQRTVLANWLKVFDRIDLLLVGRGLFIVLVVVALWWGRRQRFWLGLVLVVVVAPAVFFNLYVVHDYYLVAVSPALAALVGLATSWLWSRRPSQFSSAAYAVVLVVVWIFWVIAPAWSYIEWVYKPPFDDFVYAASELRHATPDGAPVVYLGAEWNPTIVYYSRHPGLMLDPAIVDEPRILNRLPREPYRYVFSFTPDKDPIQLLSQWKWVGVIGPRTYIVGDRRGDVDNAPVFASTSPTRARAPSAVADLACGSSRLTIAARRVHVTSDPSDRLRLRVGRDLAPLPRVGTIYVRSGGRLSCRGASSIGVSVDPE